MRGSSEHWQSHRHGDAPCRRGLGSGGDDGFWAVDPARTVRITREHTGWGRLDLHRWIEIGRVRFYLIYFKSWTSMSDPRATKAYRFMGFGF
jgi:hypothetical protein